MQILQEVDNISNQPSSRYCGTTLAQLMISSHYRWTTQEMLMTYCYLFTFVYLNCLNGIISQPAVALVIIIVSFWIWSQQNFSRICNLVELVNSIFILCNLTGRNKSVRLHSILWVGISALFHVCRPLVFTVSLTFVTFLWQRCSYMEWMIILWILSISELWRNLILSPLDIPKFLADSPVFASR